MHTHCFRHLTGECLQHVRGKPVLGREMCGLPRNLAEKPRGQRGRAADNLSRRPALHRHHRHQAFGHHWAITDQRWEPISRSGAHQQCRHRLVATQIYMRESVDQARTISSNAMAMRLRQLIEAGFGRTSPVERSGIDASSAVETRTTRLTAFDHTMDLASDPTDFWQEFMSPRLANLRRRPTGRSEKSRFLQGHLRPKTLVAAHDLDT